MERKVKTLSCGITSSECSTNNCPGYVGTGFGCLYSVVIEKTVEDQKKPVVDKDLVPLIGRDGRVIYVKKHNGRNEI